MRSSLALAVLTLAAGCITMPPTDPGLVVRNVSVIDGTGAPVRERVSVHIRGDRIIRIAPARSLEIPRGARVIDGEGKFLIPGLWDMHVHALRGERPDLFFPLFIANGVLGVRDMGTPLDDFASLSRIRAEIASGARIGPRIVASGPPLDGGKQARPELSMRIATPDEARSAARMLAERGADFLKVVNFVEPDVYRALMAESKRVHLPVAGHIPWALSAADVSDAGQKSIEHLGSAYVGVLLSCSTEEEKIRSEIVAAINDPKATAASVLPINRELSARALATFDAGKASLLYQRFRRNGTWQVPTLALLRSFAYGNYPDFVRDDRLAYLPEAMTTPWLPHNNVFYRGMTPEQAQHGRELFAKQMEVVGGMHREGVRILAGSDTPNPFVFPGFSLHDELALLVRAGMTPMEALQSATSSAAEYLGVSDRLGTIEEGKLADCVLLSANPLERIENTRAIEAVIAAGRLFTREELRALLDASQRGEK